LVAAAPTVETLKQQINAELSQVKISYPDARSHIYKVHNCLGKICSMHKRIAREVQSYRTKLKQVQKARTTEEETEIHLRRKVATLKEQLVESERAREEQRGRLQKLALVNDELQQHTETLQKKEQSSAQRMQALEESLRTVQEPPVQEMHS